MLKRMLVIFCVLFAGTSMALAQDALKEVAGYDYTSKTEKKLSLTKLPTVLVFLSAKCPCSNSHIEHLAELQQKHSHVQVIGVHSSYDETQEQGQSYFDKKKLGFPVLRDPDAKIADKVGALRTPHVFVLNTQGVVVYAGPVSDASLFPKAKRRYLDEFLTTIKSGAAFEPVTKKPLGCFISRKKS